jgi:hypothetical protein
MENNTPIAPTTMLAALVTAVAIWAVIGPAPAERPAPLKIQIVSQR